MSIFCPPMISYFQKQIITDRKGTYIYTDLYKILKAYLTYLNPLINSKHCLDAINMSFFVGIKLPQKNLSGSKEICLVTKQLTLLLQIFPANTIDFTEGCWAQRRKSSPDGFEKQNWDLTCKCLNQMNQMQPTLCTAQGMKSAYYLTELQKSAPFTQEARFPTSEWSCMNSVIAK